MEIEKGCRWKWGEELVKRLFDGESRRHGEKVGRWVKPRAGGEKKVIGKTECATVRCKHRI